MPPVRTRYPVTAIRYAALCPTGLYNPIPLPEDKNMMKGGIGNLMKQAQKMQEEMQRAQEELARATIVGEAGGGLVKVTMNGRHEVKSVELDPTLMNDDKEMLEDLIAAACNDAVHRIEEQTKEQMSGLTAGLNLPPGMKLPF